MATKNKNEKKILPKNISKSENKSPKKVVISNNKIKTLPKIPINQIISSKSFKDRLDSIVNEIDVDISDIPEELLDDYYDMEDEIKPKLIKKNWLLWSSIFIPFVLPSYIKGMSGTVELPPDAKQSVLVPAPAPKQVTDYAKQYFTDHGLELVRTLTQTDCERLKIQMLNNWGMGENKFAESFKENYTNSKARLETIYRTEKVKAENEGIMARAKNANHTKVIWNCALDERSCEICSSLQGQVTNIGEVFEGTNVTSPPIHPSCRCVLTSLTEEDYDELPDEYIRQDAAYLSEVAEELKLNYKCPKGTVDDGFSCGGEGKSEQKGNNITLPEIINNRLVDIKFAEHFTNKSNERIKTIFGSNNTPALRLMTDDERSEEGINALAACDWNKQEIMLSDHIVEDEWRRASSTNGLLYYFQHGENWDVAHLLVNKELTPQTDKWKYKILQNSVEYSNNLFDHELGHILLSKALGNVESLQEAEDKLVTDGFKKIVEDAANGGWKSPTQYSKASFNEMFAECFSLYINNRKDLLTPTLNEYIENKILEVRK